MGIFRQLLDYDSNTFTYLLADSDTKEAIHIDPVFERVDRDVQLIRELGLTLKYVLETHTHADHITGAGELRKRLNSKTVVPHGAEIACADRELQGGECLPVGSLQIKAIATPGHTSHCLSYLVGNLLFSGDTLCIRTAGRTDFQGGSPSRLYDSIMSVYSLPDETMVYPSHDYAGFTVSTIGEEKRFNRRITALTTRKQFIEIMNNLNLPNPKKIDTAVPANRNCGQVAK